MPDVVKLIERHARDVHGRINKGHKPSVRLPIRSLSNVRYRPSEGYLKMIGKSKIRTLTVNTVKTFAQTLRMLAMCKELIGTRRHSTKREAYYQAYNW